MVELRRGGEGRVGLVLQLLEAEPVAVHGDPEVAEVEGLVARGVPLGLVRLLGHFDSTDDSQAFL